MCPHGRAHWRHLVNTIEPSVAAMRSYLKLLWPLVIIIVIIVIIIVIIIIVVIIINYNLITPVVKIPAVKKFFLNRL